MDNIVRTEVLVSELLPGWTVEKNGLLYTVGKEDVKKTFCGFAFRGDASKKTITRVQFAVPTAAGVVLR